MAFKGIVYPIPLGQGGLHTDDSPNTIPKTDLIVANNVSLHNNLIEKDFGSAPFNTSAIPDGIYGAYDWWPTTNISDRKLIVLGGDGKTYAIDNTGAATEITASGGAPATLTVTNQVFFVAGGIESSGRSRKLFILTGSDQIQVIAGTNTTRASINEPDTTWGSTGKYPRAGKIVNGRLAVWGADNNPHALYMSDSADHEKMVTNALQFSVFPGEGERLTTGFVVGGRFFMLKYPQGAYSLVSDSPTSSNWYIKQHNSQLGAASPYSAAAVLNDVLIKTASDQIISIAAVQEFGDIKGGDVFNILKMETFIRDNTNPSGAQQTHLMYYEDKKLLFATYRSTLGSSNDRMVVLKLESNGKTKAVFNTKDAPNCLALRKDTNGVKRPIYGSLDGYIYEMDQIDRNVDGAAFAGEFQTPHMDFADLGKNMADTNKNYQFLSLRYIPQGDWNIYADIYIDGNYYETVTFEMNGDDLLADDTVEATDFILAESSTDPEGSELSGEDLLTVMKPLRGTGRTISVKIYNTGNDETFKIAQMFIGFTPSGQQQR